MEALVIGAGIGGLATALALHDRGIAVTVLEGAETIREAGVGINTLPHAIAVLEGWGLLPALDAAGIRTSTLVYRTARGQAILSQKRGLAAGLDAPQFSIHRGRLQSALLEAARARLGDDRIRTGHRLTGFEQDGQGVTARFANGEALRGDLLVGADGIHSTVRRAMVGEEGPPSWNGISMWRGAAWAPAYGDGATMVIAGGMGLKFVLYPIATDPMRPDEALTNWVVCASTGAPGDPPPEREDWSRRGSADEALAHVDNRLDLPEIDVAALIRSTQDIYVYPMCDRDPLARWSEGRVTLLGDAAHPMYPVGSNGASQAILDAVALAEALDGAPVETALAAYDAARRPATAAIVLVNREGGPERVIDLVESRAPGGFEDLDAVASPAELRALVGDYHRMTGMMPA